MTKLTSTLALACATFGIAVAGSMTTTTATADNLRPYVSFAATHDMFEWNLGGGAVFDDESFGYKPAIGFDYKIDGSFVEAGLEAGYRFYSEYEEAGVSIEADGFTLGGHAGIRLTDSGNIRVKLHGGVFFWEVDATIPGVGSGSEDGDDFFYGIGLDFAATEQFTIGLLYEHQDFAVDGAPDPEIDSIGLRGALYF
ncbi:MAG: outer membrane beta-barrel protein [Alphaproteobacteria bacterium]